jgi:hypothetical protein
VFVAIRIKTVYCQMLSGARYEFKPCERLDYFPTDEPLLDMVEIEIDRDGDASLICPCGERLVLGSWLDEAIAEVGRHVKQRHPERS